MSQNPPVIAGTRIGHVHLKVADLDRALAFYCGVVGVLRDLSGSYTLPFYGCIALELAAAVLIMIRGRAKGLQDPAAW